MLFCHTPVLSNMSLSKNSSRVSTKVQWMTVRRSGDVIEETTDYMAWFCGHWHTNKRIDKMHFLFHQFESSEELQKMKVNKTNLEREMEDGEDILYR